MARVGPAGRGGRECWEPRGRDLTSLEGKPGAPRRRAGATAPAPGPLHLPLRGTPSIPTTTRLAPASDLSFRPSPPLSHTRGFSIICPAISGTCQTRPPPVAVAATSRHLHRPRGALLSLSPALVSQPPRPHFLPEPAPRESERWAICPDLRPGRAPGSSAARLPPLDPRAHVLPAPSRQLGPQQLHSFCH